MSLFGSLIGGVLGIFGKKSDDKAAQRAADEANRNAQQAAQTAADLQVRQQQVAFEQTLTLQQMQNEQVNATNGMIDLHNKTIGGTTSFASMVRDAEAAGFNPLTVLRAGGAAGYSVPFMTYMSHSGPSSAPQPLPAPVAVTHQRQATSSWSDVAGTFGTGISNYLNRDPLAGERSTLELGIARAQLANLNSDTNANNRRFAVPSWTDPGVSYSSGGFSGAVKGVLGAVATPEYGGTKVTNAWPTSWGWTTSPNIPDAGDIEQANGDWVAGPYGVVKTVYEIGDNLARTAPALAAADYVKQQYNALVKSWGGPAGFTRQLTNPAPSGWGW